MMRDFTSGFRQFLLRPFFCFMVVMLIAIGVGANILIFGFIDTLLLKPLPVRQPGNLWILQTIHTRQLQPDLDFTYGQFEQLQAYPRLFAALTAEQTWGSAAAYPARQDGGPGRLVMTQMVAPNYFTELDVHAILGRVLDQEDAKASTNIPIVLSYQFWQSRYGRQSNVIGQTLRIKGFPFVVVGVLPRDFHSIDIDRAPDVRLPISAALLLHGRPVEDPRGGYHEGFHVLARLRTGVDPKLVEKMAGPAIRKFLCNEFVLVNTSLPKPFSPAEVQETMDWFNEGHLSLAPIGQGLSRLREQFTRALQLLMAGVFVLLLTVCANVTGLLLARGEERRKDLALRLSIGAGRWRLLRQLMIENLCLAIPGGLLGWLLAFAGAPLIISLLPEVRGLDQFASTQILAVTPDLRILLFAWLALLVSLCFFGLFPAWRATRLDVSAELKGSTARAAGNIAALVPVTTQIALSLLLLCAGGLMLRTYWNLQHLNPGFDRDHVVSFTMGMKDAALTNPQAKAYLRELQERLKGIPGVRATGYSLLGLMRGSGVKTTLTPAGKIQPSSVYLNANEMGVSPSYFDTLGVRLLAGRTLNEHDRDTKPEKVVVNRALASLLFPRTDPIGQLIVRSNDGTRPPDYQVVGVVETAKYRSMHESAAATLYSLPYSEDYGSVVYLRTNGNPADVIRPAERIILKLGGGVNIIEASTLEQEIQNSLWQERLVAGLAGFFSLVALLLAGIGLYGALAYSVARRKRELGIRMAIGAHIRHILKTICGRMAVAVAVGIALGGFISAAAMQFFKAFLFEVQPFDWPSFLGATLAVILCACLAASIPAWRAVRTNAANALREQ